MNHEEFHDLIDKLELSDFRNELDDLSLPCLHLLTEIADLPVPSDESKIGGLPDLPRGMAWPTTPGDSQIPMLFLGRIAAKDVARIYPGIHGHLLFFAEWIYGHDGMVLQIPIDTEVFPVSYPTRPEDAHPPLVECRVNAVDAISLPGIFMKDSPERKLYSRELLHFKEKADRFWGESVMHPLVEDLIWRTMITNLEEPNRGVFRFGGYPLHVQSHPISNANLNEPTKGITDWCNLMSFGDDEICDLSYGDTGFCGFMTTRRAIDSGKLSFLYFYQDSM